MFEVGFTEIILILGLGLLVLGPEKLPKLAAQVGRWTGRARAMARQLRNQLDQEVAFQDRRAAHGRGESPAGSAPTPGAGVASAATVTATAPGSGTDPTPPVAPPYSGADIDAAEAWPDEFNGHAQPVAQPTAADVGAPLEPTPSSIAAPPAKLGNE